MTRLRQAIRCFFNRLSAARKLPKPRASSHTGNSERLQELRRPHSRNSEIRPPSSECELPFGTELGVFHDKTASRVTEEAAGRIKISVNRIRFR